MSKIMETVLVVGATGNIGVAAISGALRTKRNVLAIVRSQSSADKLFKHIGTKDGITTVEADVTSETGVQGVVEQVKAGKLPAFQHVYSCVGKWVPGKMHEIDSATYHDGINTLIGSNFWAYRATIPYLLQQNKPNSTFTVCTGGAGEMGSGGVTALTQGALFSMVTAAARELNGTNVRVNEAFLNARVEYDDDAERKGGSVTKSSEYGELYANILDQQNLDGYRISCLGPKDLDASNKRKKSQWKV